jgi:DNA-directed RNA polymerase specialized sigma24 family protein
LERAGVVGGLRIAPVAGLGWSRSTLVEGLPNDERDAVTARVIDERAYSEIAVGMRCSELVVRKRVSRGLGRLRAQVRRDDG